MKMIDLRPYIWSWILLTLPIMSAGQNLVPNPSFEDYYNCPNGISAIAYSPGYTSFPTVKFWVNPVNNSSPDYLHTCAPVNTGVHVPEATFGHQWPRTGIAYAGIVAWEGHYTNGNLTLDFREYVQCRLLQPLQAGKRYCLVFYVSPSINLLGNFNYKSVDQVGANFSVNQQSAATGYNLQLTSHVTSPAGQFLVDTGNWIKISGDYIASGGEEWLTIGSFYNGNTPGKIQAYPIPANTTITKERAYMYIDDVSVYPISLKDTSFTVHDSSYCNNNALPMVLNSLGVQGSYLWSTGATTSAIIVTGAGKYWCTSVTDCQVFVDTFTVGYKPDTKLNFIGDLVNCKNEAIEIKPNKVFNVYNWSTGETTPTITVNKSGVYILTATNKCGTQTDTAIVHIQEPTPIPFVSDTIVCQLTTGLKLNVKGTNLNWYTHPAGLIGTPVQPDIVTRDVATYSVYVTQTIGKCESPKVKIDVDIRYQPRHILDDKAVMCLNDIQLIGKEASNDVTYKWGTGQNICCIEPTYEGLHRVAINSPFCGTYIDSIRVVFSLCDTCITVPNAFSPNGDGKNDKYKAILMCPVSEFHMAIFDRWGRKVFETHNPNEEWDGSALNIMAENGVYIYTIDYRSKSTSIPKFIKGNITLMR